MLSTLANLLTPRRSSGRRAALEVPAGERIYAIGDIHGRSDLLRVMMGELKEDAKGYKGLITLVGIGDYIDRGPDSKGVVEVLLNEVPRGWKQVFLRGNHEQAMLNFLKEPDMQGEWLVWGGLQALESYGILPYGAHGMRNAAQLAAEFKYAIDEAGHTAFYEATEIQYERGGYLFVHAGVRPGIPAGRQMAEDLLFIRDDFLKRPHSLPYRVVFGHTILDEPMVLEDRIGLDTGAFQSGVLTAVKLEGETTDILQALDAAARKMAANPKQHTEDHA